MADSGTEQSSGGAQHLPPQPDDPSVLREPLPVQRSIPWVPVAEADANPATLPYPLFVAQRALLALQQFEGAAGGTIGFLVGRLGLDPATGARYAVIRDVVTLPQPFFGDRPLPVIAKAFKRVTQELPPDGTQVLGWHHTHGVHGIMLTLADVETHRQFFPQAFQVALVTAVQDGHSAACFYRPQATAGGHTTAPLPFYELCDELPASGVAQTCLTWAGYRSTDPRVAPPRPRPSRGQAGLLIAAELVRPSGVQVLMPVSGHDPDDPAWAGHRRPWPRLPRAALYPLIAALGAGAVLGLNALRGPRPDRAAPAAAATVTPLQDSLAQATDALDRAIRAYLEKQSLFDQRMMVCADLANGLVDVEASFVAYSAMQGRVTPAADSAATLRVAPLLAAVDSVDRHYGRSGCARP